MGKKVAASGVAEQSGKECRHTALHGHAALVLIQVQHAAGPPADGAAHLQSSALAPSAAAARWVSTVLINMTGSSQNRMGCHPDAVL